MAEFDWVKARSECSPAKVFQQLRLGIEADVKGRQRSLGPNPTIKFTTVSDRCSITALIEGQAGTAVTFDQTEDGIRVRNEADGVLLEATLTLNNDGQCRLKVGGQEYELWQFRKMALEQLLFG